MSMLPEGPELELEIARNRLEHADLKIARLQERVFKLENAAVALRAAQRAYLADRGNETLGRAVGVAADELDRVLAEYFAP